MKTLYLECCSGISGDMTVAALLDLGADEKNLLAGLKSLDVGGYDIEISRVKKCGIDACDFSVNLHENAHAHDDNCAHAHDESHGHDNTHSHDHAHRHEDSHEHRNIDDIIGIIDTSAITDKAKTLAKSIFNIVAEAEADVHGLPVAEVHFHEVGAVDSIVDIVGTAICVDNLGIGRVICTPLREGQGTVKCQHGRVPVPAPATLKIAETHKIPLIITQNQGEMVTPTGAAIAAALAESFDPTGCFGPNSGMVISKTGCGAGKKDFAIANILRASIVEPVSAGNSGEVVELNCNIDDMTGEQLAYACELFMQKGALDCWLTPIIMKKGRPAQMLSLLTEPPREDEFTRLIFLHTSTIGIRSTMHRRAVMSRRAEQVETEYGALDIKECSYGNICKTGIEYESAKALAESHNIPISQIYRSGENAQK